MYAVYKQAHPPTGLEFSMYCNFFSNTERNLVLAGTSQLYVYRLNHDSEVLQTVCLGCSWLSICLFAGGNCNKQVLPKRMCQMTTLPPPLQALVSTVIFIGLSVCLYL